MMTAVITIFGSQLRRDRWVLTFWISGVAAFGLAVAAAITSQFDSPSDRTAIVTLSVANPAIVFARGLPDGDSVGAVAFFTGFAFTAVLAGLMSTFLVVRHSRADEETGRAELLAATPIARSAMLTATIALGVLANLLVAGALTLAYAAGGLPVESSVVAALVVGSVGLVFVGVAALVAQVMPSGRAANGAATALVIGAYLVRGIGDALGAPSDDLLRVEPSALSWLSPIGWGQATRPYTEPNLLPLVISVLAFAVSAVVAIVVRAQRDLGSSLVPEKRGRATASLGGHSVLGLAWRLQRATVLGWLGGAVVLGAVAGGLAPVVAEGVADNASLSALIARLAPGGSSDTVDVFVAALLGIGGVLAGAAGVQAVLRLRAEESEGRAELLLATPVTRSAWVGATAFVAAVSVVTVVLAMGVATGAAIARSTGTSDEIVRYVGAGLAHAPAALVFVALSTLIVATLPRVTVALGWGLLVIGFVLGQFGELLQLPEWLQAASPFFHTSAAPVVEVDLVAVGVLLAVALGFQTAALIALRRRDLTA